MKHQTPSFIRFLPAALLAVMAVCTGATHAQNSYPTKPVRVIVPFPPAGATDIIARTMAERLSAALGQPFIIENKSGASGNIGMEAVAHSPADGYTLAIGAPQTIVINPLLMKNMTFAPQKELTPIVVIAEVPNVLIVNPKLGVKTVQELVKLAQSKPGKLNYASTSIGGTPHLTAELFKIETKTFITHIPYRGSMPALQDVIGGQVDMMFDNLPASLPHIKSGLVRALAVTTSKRSVSAPDIPTMEEAGIAGVNSQGWFSLLAPAGTPQAILERLNAQVNKIIATPEFRERMRLVGADVVGGSIADFRKRIDSENQRWGTVIKQAGVTAE